MKKSSLFLSLILSVSIAFVSVFTLFSCNNSINKSEVAPAWAVGDWVVDNKKVFTVHSDGQTVYDIAGLSALKLEWNEPVTIDGDTYTAVIRRNENDIFETQLKSTKENSSIPSYLYTKITKSDDENYSYSTFAPFYGLDVEPIYANSSKAVKGVEGEGDIKSGSESEDYAGAYLTFRSQSSFDVASNGGGGEKVWDGEIEYSYDTSTWQAWDGKTISSSENDGEHKLYLRGKGNSHFTKDGNNWVIEGVAVYCDGDIRTLMDYESYESIKSAPVQAFKHMFRNNQSLISAPSLPFEKVGYECFDSMFEKCTSLTTPPALPATTLAGGCYEYMFSYCTSLTSAPALPATTLASSCYNSMFSYCTSLTSAPALPATNIANSCYAYMFEKCTSLKTPPALPATKLANQCYYEMFFGCSSLTSVPVLPATELAGMCYNRMFCYAIVPDWSKTKSAKHKNEFRIGKGGDELSLDCMFGYYFTPEPDTVYYFATDVKYLDIEEAEDPFSFKKDKISLLVGSQKQIPISSPVPFWYYGSSSVIKSLISKDTSIATIDSTGLITAKAPGETVITITRADGKTYEYTISVSDGVPDNYLTFKSPSAFSVSFNSEQVDNKLGKVSWDGTIYYSKDAVNWKVWNGEKVISNRLGGVSDFVLYFAGRENTCLSKRGDTSFSKIEEHEFCCSGDISTLWDLLDYGDASFFKIEGTEVSCSGDIRTLLDYVDYNSIKKAADNIFEGLFRGNSALISAPELPFEELGDNCFRDMFNGCTSLTTPPDLPAKTLASNCYRGMFQKCTSLTTPPVLPAETLANYCYFYMFYGCTSLKTPPVLPAETLANYCYFWMFADCTSLTTTPTLPAKSIKEGCYQGMFQNCTSLKTPPALPATTIEAVCYSYMFRGCTSLTSAPALPATTLKTWCYEGMFSGCTSLKFSEKRSAEYKNEFRVGENTEHSRPFDNMFNNTGGDVPETPSVGKVYYCANDVIYIGEPESISFMKDEISLFVDDQLSEQCITREPWYSNPPVIESWTSSNPAVAAVDASGKITAIAPGTATITAASTGGKTATCQIIVYEKILTQNIVENIKPGDHINIAATERKITWSSSDPSIAKVDENGKIEAVSPGTTTIIAQYHIETLASLIEVPGTSTMIDQDSSDIAAICKITVDPIPVESITLSKTSDTLTVGDSLPLTATISPAEATYQTITWESSNTSVATVDKTTGEITAIAPGTTTITAKNGYDDVSGTCTITVNSIPVESIDISKTSATLTVGGTLKLTATISPANASYQTIIWESSNTSVATVDKTTGKITAIAPGTATITAKNGYDDVTSTCTITVNPVLVNSITLSKTSATLTVGDTLTLTAKISPANATDKSIIWTSSAPSIATVNKTTGKITAVAPGKTTITVKSSNSNVTASCTVTVNPKPVAVNSISLSTESITLLLGDTRNLSATISPANATDKKITWTSSSSTVSVDASGKITANAPGAAKIIAKSSNNKTATCTVNVITCSSTSVPLTPVASRMNDGNILSISTSYMKLSTNSAYKLMGVTTPPYAGGNHITWTSSNPSIAEVDGTGRIRSKSKTGTAYITASCKGASVVCRIDVVYKNPQLHMFNGSVMADVNDGYVTVRLLKNQTPLKGLNKKNIHWSLSNESIGKIVDVGDAREMLPVIDFSSSQRKTILVDSEFYYAKIKLFKKAGNIKVTVATDSGDYTMSTVHVVDYEKEGLIVLPL